VSENNRSLPDDRGDALREVGPGMLGRRRCTLSVRERWRGVKGCRRQGSGVTSQESGVRDGNGPPRLSTPDP
jgi:hypothetical protein